MTKIRILLTGAGAPGGPGIIKALLAVPEFDLWIADADADASGRGLLPDRFVQIPRATDDSFIETIEQICLSREIQVVLPLVTLELFKFSAVKQKFADKNIAVVVSENEGLAVANNKGLLLEHLRSMNLSVPHFMKVHTWDELCKAAKSLGYPNNKVCIKPSVSNGSRGFRVLDASFNPSVAFFKDKPNNVGCNLESLAPVFQNNEFPEMLVMEYLPGEEYTVDSLVVEHEPILILPRKRMAMNNGITTKGQFLNIPEIISYSNRILRSLNLSGPIGIQFKADSAGIYKILEINPRLQGTSVSAMGMGINLPALAVYAALGKKEQLLNSNIQWGLRFARYYDEIYFQD